MLNELAFYVSLRCVSVQNPEIVPLFFQNRWFGQDVIKKELRLVVGHTKNLEHRADLVQSEYHTLLGANFEIDEKNPFRKVTLSLAGNIFSEVRVFADLWFDLNQPHQNCGITLSPVPIGRDGKPQVPDEPGLRAMVGYLLANPDCVNWKVNNFLNTVYEYLESIKVKDANAYNILTCLCNMRIVEMLDEGKAFFRTMSCDNINYLFGSQLQ
jgi:hypothetical protein